MQVSKNFGAGKALREGPVPINAHRLPAGPREKTDKALVQKDLQRIPRSLKLLLKAQEQRRQYDEAKAKQESRDVKQPGKSEKSDSKTTTEEHMLPALPKEPLKDVPKKKRKSRVSEASMEKIKQFEVSVVTHLPCSSCCNDCYSQC